MSARTKPEIFIIESLDWEDEAAERFEGKLLAQMLKLAGKKETQYFYIRTKAELHEVIDRFDESGYRYLHISCHGGEDGMSTTLDAISNEELGEMLAPCLDDRRVFLSACEMTNDGLAKELLADTGCYSLIGPAKDIPFTDAAAFWLAFYHLMFKHSDEVMKHEQLHQNVSILSKVFGEPINYFRSSKRPPGFRKIDFNGL